MSTDKNALEGMKRADPSILTKNLAVAAMSDTVDLDVWPKAFEIANTTAATIAVKFTPIGEFVDTVPDPVVELVPAGSVRPFDCGARRIWSTGSTGLAAAITAGTASVLLHLR